MTERLDHLACLERRLLWLSTWMIHNANHLRPSDDGLKVGGHQASSASLATIMTALYFDALRPEDRVAVKPHASPIFHAIQYLMGNQTREKLEAFRGYRGAQSYPSRTKDVDDVDFSTGSVGLGVAMTSFASLVQDYIHAKGWGTQWPMGRMVALVGDAELDEGNIYEALLEGFKHGLRNTWWIIDYNRQSLDAVLSHLMTPKLESLFDNMGWKVVTIRYGKKLEGLRDRPGGDRILEWIDGCDNALYSALAFEGGWRRELENDLKGERQALDLIGGLSDEELADLMTDLGGHCLETVLDAFLAAPDDRPTCFICHTVKGKNLPFAGHKDNHAGLMTPDQMSKFKAANNILDGQEWSKVAGLNRSEPEFEKLLSSVPFNARGPRRLTAKAIDPGPLPLPPIRGTMSTQQGFGQILAEIARSESKLSERIVTCSPDVTVSTNLGPWVNRRGIFARHEVEDVFQARKLMSVQRWYMGPNGQHIELGIAENNLFILLAALGLSHELFGERLIPIGTLYDPFIARGLDALNYACYQEARFILVATPSGITLAPEGGAHQSIATPLIGMAQDGLASFEPAFVDELAVIMGWGFRHMQRDAGEGGSVYLRLSTRTLDQPQRIMAPELQSDITEGAYWLREPGPNCDLVIAYTGAVAPEAIEAVGLIGESHRDVGLLAVTSADRLHAGWSATRNLRRERRGIQYLSHVEKLLAPLPRDCGIVTVIDGHPAALGWLGSVRGNRVEALGVEQFGQTGTIGDLYRHYGIDANAIIDAAESLTVGAPVRHRKMAV
jgi:pyruvate dehydrogenase E1 component